VTDGARGSIEESVSRIWRDVLGLAEVGRHDNFFDLGGTSIFIPQVVSRVNEAFDVQLSHLNLLESPTVSGLAECVEVVLRLERRSDGPPARRGAPPAPGQD
jgi:hypothetical protein